MAESDCIFIQGSNMAENHPVGFQWVMEAKARGATIIHVDPRFTRTSAVADIHATLRAGTDIVFLGALVNYVLVNEADFREYVVAYTNAPAIISEDFQDAEDLAGIFSGYDEEKRSYDTTTWEYERARRMAEGSGEGAHEAQAAHAASRAEAAGSGGPTVGAKAERDETLEHPRCVYQILKRHFARY